MAGRGPYLGIDAGGTSTQAVLVAEDGTVLGRGRGGAGNHNTIGIERARDSVVTAVRAALKGTNEIPTAVAFGSAGLEAPGDLSTAMQLLPDELRGCAIVFDTDALMALEGALGGHAGIVIAVGTGAIAFGRDLHGQRAFASGWGWRIGDEGSAYWIGVRALNAVSKALDGRGPRTMLVELIQDRLQASGAQSVVGWTYHSDRDPSDIAGLASLVDAAAVQGDEVALRILSDATAELLGSVEAVFRRMENTWGLPVPVSYNGGVFKSQIVTSGFEAGLRSRGWGVARPPIMSPVLGAALHAWRLGHAQTGRSDEGLWKVEVPERVLRALQEGQPAPAVRLGM